MSLHNTDNEMKPESIKGNEQTKLHYNLTLITKKNPEMKYYHIQCAWPLHLYSCCLLWDDSKLENFLM